MKILIVNTFERAGGAAIAASRLHLGLRERGHESTLLVRQRTPQDPVGGVLVVPEDRCPALGRPLLAEVVGKAYRDLHAVPGAFFSPDFPARDLSALPAVRDADVVNVHWVARTLSVAAIRRIQDLGKPVVWTLHDQLPFTGGCHYSGDCDGYEEGCHDCPQLLPAARVFPAATLAGKREWLDASRLAVVSPSEWLASCARRSALLRGADVRVIANSVPVDEYQRPHREEARRRLALPQGAVVVLVGSDRLDEPRKGHAHFLAALERLAADATIVRAVRERRLVFASFGTGDLTGAAVPIVSIGRTNGDREAAAAFRAADLFVLPTVQDNLPNTLLESIASGTPVVAYRTGGIPDLLGTGARGRVVPRGDVGALAATLGNLIHDAPARAAMRLECEAFARERLDYRVQADAYIDLYREVIARERTRDAALPTSSAEFAAAVAASERRHFADALSLDGASLLLQCLCDAVDVREGLATAAAVEVAALRARVAELEAAAVDAAGLRR